VSQSLQPHGHPGHKNRTRLGAGWLGYVIISVVVVQSFIFYHDLPARMAFLLLLAIFTLLYVSAAPLAARFGRYPFVYFSLQTAVILALSSQKPYLDIVKVLYVPLSLQALQAVPFRAAAAWLALFALCLTASLVLALGWLEGMALSLLIMAVSVFLLSYDRLGAQMQSDQEESQCLLVELQQAHEKLKEHAGQARELAATRERNRLARELHDSVSQGIFAIVLTSQAARLLLERDPARVPEQLDHLQEMTTTVLSQLRSLIAQLRPPPKTEARLPSREAGLFS
jgi:signal transduction histidine kinase